MFDQTITLDLQVALNADLATRHLVDLIYDQAILEGIATTRADTAAIIEGGKVHNMTADDVLKTRNLQKAWRFICQANVLLSPSNWPLLSHLNAQVEEGFYYTAGQIRTVPVAIGGTSWRPPLPLESAIKEELAAISQSPAAPFEMACAYLLYIMRKQIFLDGNKRTAVLFANHYLISHAGGLLAIPDIHVPDFQKLLVGYYETGGTSEILGFLHQHCHISLT